VLDTAGLRETDGGVEAMGISLARRRAQAADMRVILTDPGSPDDDLGIQMQEGDLLVRGKADLATAYDDLAVSVLTGAGMAELIQRISAALEGRAALTATITHARQRAAIMTARAALNSAAGRLEAAESDPVLVAEDLRGALRALDVLVGKTDV